MIQAGLTLAYRDVEAVVAMDRQGRVDGVITGYTVLREFLRGDIWKSLYETRSGDKSWATVQSTYNDYLNDLIRKLYSSNLKYSIVFGMGKPSNLIGLKDLAKYLEISGRSTFLESMEAEAISNPRVRSISGESSLEEAIRTMVNEGVGSLCLRGSQRIISVKSIIRGVMKSSILEKLRDNPHSILQKPIKELPELHVEAIKMKPGMTAKTALSNLLKSSSECMISPDQRRIITYWDLVVKPSIKQEMEV